MNQNKKLILWGVEAILLMLTAGSFVCGLFVASIMITGVAIWQAVILTLLGGAFWALALLIFLMYRWVREVEKTLR